VASRWKKRSGIDERIGTSNEGHIEPGDLRKRGFV